MAHYSELHSRPLPRAYKAVADVLEQDATVKQYVKTLLRWQDSPHETVEVPPVAMLPLLRLHVSSVQTVAESTRTDSDRMEIATELFIHGLDLLDALGVFEACRDAVYSAVRDGRLRQQGGIDTAYWSISGSMAAISGEQRVLVVTGSLLVVLARPW